MNVGGKLRVPFQRDASHRRALVPALYFSRSNWWRGGLVLTEVIKNSTQCSQQQFSSSLCINACKYSACKKTTEREWSEVPWKETLERLDEPGLAVDSSLYAALLRHCGNSKALLEGKRIHAHIRKTGHLSNRYLRNLLLQMYAKCGALQDASDLFAKINQPDVFSWTFIITAHAHVHRHDHAHRRHGLSHHLCHGEAALHLFQQMQQQGELPNDHTFVGILSVCANHTLLSSGKSIHALIVGGRDYDSDLVIVTALINMYGKCGCLFDAQDLFYRMPDRSLVSWNVLIAALTQHGQGEKTLALFQQMQEESWIPSKVTFLEILNACASQSALADGKRIHSVILGTGLGLEVTLGNSLVNMYAKCVSLENAWGVFDMMPERNVITWNTLIAAYGQCKHMNEFLQLFQQMQLEGVILNELTFIIILSTCASMSATAKGREVHARLVSCGFGSNIAIGTALISMYSKCGDLKAAQLVFDMMLEHNLISWNALITAYAHHSDGKRAFELFLEMQNEGFKPDRITMASILDAFTSETALAEGQHLHCQTVEAGLESDVVVATALVDMYGKCGGTDNALRVFDMMPNRNIVSWTAMIGAYAQHGRGFEALQLFQQMQVCGLIPDRISLISVLDACASQAALAKGKQIHSCILSCGFESDVVVANSLINMYAKCGSLEDALRVFNKMQEPNVISWTTLVAAYAQQGQGKEAVDLFFQMHHSGSVPDEATLRSMLTACSHGGLVVEGGQCFVSLNDCQDTAVSVDHYNHLVDLLGRMGKLAEGEDLINKMPFQPTSMSWLTLLGACRMHSDVERGEQAAKNIFALEPENSAPYVLLSNIHAAAGRCDKHLPTSMR